MRLLDTLIKKRDHHLALAQKFADLIAVVTDDLDFAKHTHSHNLSVMDQAKALVAAHGNGNGNGLHETLKGTQTPEFRRKQSARMKKLWKDKRSVMMKGVRKGHTNAMKVRRRQIKERKAQEATT